VNAVDGVQGTKSNPQILLPRSSYFRLAVSRLTPQQRCAILMFNERAARPMRRAVSSCLGCHGTGKLVWQGRLETRHCGTALEGVASATDFHRGGLRSLLPSASRGAWGGVGSRPFRPDGGTGLRWTAIGDTTAESQSTIGHARASVRHPTCPGGTGRRRVDFLLLAGARPGGGGRASVEGR